MLAREVCLPADLGLILERQQAGDDAWVAFGRCGLPCQCQRRVGHIQPMSATYRKVAPFGADLVGVGGEVSWKEGGLIYN